MKSIWKVILLRKCLLLALSISIVRCRCSVFLSQKRSGPIKGKNKFLEKKKRNPDNIDNGSSFNPRDLIPPSLLFFHFSSFSLCYERRLLNRKIDSSTFPMSIPSFAFADPWLLSLPCSRSNDVGRNHSDLISLYNIIYILFSLSLPLAAGRTLKISVPNLFC